MTEVAAYPLPLIERLLDWCARNAECEPAAVCAIGLAYACGLNEHQIAAARIVEAGPPVAVDFPLARRASEVHTARRRTIVLESPSWFTAAADTLVYPANHVPLGSLLFRSASPIGIPRSPSWVRALISEASAAATAHQLSCTGLSQTRLVDAAANGHPLAPYSVGFSASWAARLVDPIPTPRLPFRA